MDLITRCENYEHHVYYGKFFPTKVYWHRGDVVTRAILIMFSLRF